MRIISSLSQFLILILTHYKPATISLPGSLLDCQMEPTSRFDPGVAEIPPVQLWQSRLRAAFVLAAFEVSLPDFAQN
jgi:hypothetical protein